MSKVEVHKNLEALRLATSIGMVEPQLSLEEIEQMRFGAPEVIGMRILELSGLLPEASVKKKGRK